MKMAAKLLSHDSLWKRRVSELPEESLVGSFYSTSDGPKPRVVLTLMHDKNQALDMFNYYEKILTHEDDIPRGDDKRLELYEDAGYFLGNWVSNSCDFVIPTTTKWLLLKPFEENKIEIHHAEPFVREKTIALNLQNGNFTSCPSIDFYLSHVPFVWGGDWLVDPHF